MSNEGTMLVDDARPPQLSERAQARFAFSPQPGQYKHILVPTGLECHEHPALMLGAELACLHGALVTVMHVRTTAEHPQSVHWLSAIDHLHEALSHPPGAFASGDFDAHERVRTQIRRTLQRQLPEYLRKSARIGVECRTGNVVDQIARFVDSAEVDLVVMCAGRPRRWLPILPTVVRRILRSTRLPVILVRPGISSPDGFTR